MLLCRDSPGARELLEKRAADDRCGIVGREGHAQVIADIVLRAHEAEGKCKPVGYLDDDPQLQGKWFLGLRVLGPISELGRFGHDAVIVMIGENRTCARFFRRRGSHSRA